MIELKNLTLGYEERELLSGVNATLKPASLTALVGRNGSGKSTLLRAIASLGDIIDGTILIDGVELHRLSARRLAESVAFVSTERVRVSNLTAKEAVALGRAPYTNWLGKLSTKDEDIVRRSLEICRMESFSERRLDSLSDGECQRIMIARALAQETPIILLDEPTSFLDLPNRYELCSLLKRLSHEESKCILFSTHELDIALTMADYVALIDTPELHLKPASEMAESDLLKRLFSHGGYNFEESMQGYRSRISR